jgi:hypothetical protein
MAKPTLRTVLFHENEPLDPNKLNDLIQNIKTVYEMAIKQYSSDGTYKTVIDSGSVNVTVKKKVGLGTSGVIKSTTLSKPLMIASVGSELPDGVHVTLSIVGADTNPQIKVYMSPPQKEDRKIKINYVLVEKQLSQ